MVAQVLQPEWLQDVRVDEGIVAHSGLPLDDQREETVADIGVLFAFSGGERQLLRHCPPHEVIAGDELRVRRKTRAEPCAMANELTDGDAALVRRSLRYKTPERVVQRQPAAFDQLQDGHR